ncbi:hypothetical protein FACS1894166_01300 [Bacilli bacterium]|nr:hypothetical protein FACS1894166_01300 [Bacilli bacterium]
MTIGKISKFIINSKTKKTERRDLEIDFIAKKGDEVIYVQVSESIKDRKTFEREITPLQIIKDSHKKIIITNDHVSESMPSGISIVNIIDFLISQ